MGETLSDDPFLLCWSSSCKDERMSLKYGNVKTESCYYGYSHRSKLELAVCRLIRVRELAGEIEHLQHEEYIYLTRARIVYIADFKCKDVASGEVFYIEAKGFEAPRWPTVKKLYKFYGPGNLEIWKGTHLRPTMDEEIIPMIEAET